MKLVIDKQATYNFYQEYTPCDCEDCKNYILQIAERFSKLDKFFKKYNIDIKKPFELVSFREGNLIEYVDCQYLVFGECPKDFECEIEGIKLSQTFTHPSTKDYPKPNFVLSFSITLDNLYFEPEREGLLFSKYSRVNAFTSMCLEFAYNKKDLPIRKVFKSKNIKYRQEDSLYVYISDFDEFFEQYFELLRNPNSPDNSGEFCYYGLNYYTKEETIKILEAIQLQKPKNHEIISEWLKEAINFYYGFYIFGI